MRKFLGRLLLFLIPFYFVGAFLAAVYYTGYTTGEFCDFDQLMEAQRENHDIFIGMGYNEQTGYYKLENANYYQADVLALGTSRVMQFRSDYFGAGFYNCGGAVGWNYDQYLNFIKNLNYTPKAIILGLDQWVFNAAWNWQCIAYEAYEPIRMEPRSKISMEWKMVEDFFGGKWNFHGINRYPMNFGFNGRAKDNGYLWDGSYYYGEIYREPKEPGENRFKDTFERIAGGFGRFEWGEHMDKKSCGYLEALLEYCKGKEIEVIGFVPPYAPSVYDDMVASGKYGYLDEIGTACGILFQKYGYEYFDYTDISVLDMDDSYFVDGFHGSDVAYARMTKDMVSRGEKLKEYVEEEKLDQLLGQRYNNKMFYDFLHKE